MAAESKGSSGGSGGVKKPYPTEYPDLDPTRALTLTQWEQVIAGWKRKYGAKAVVVFDAGYGSISVLVNPTKQVRK